MPLVPKISLSLGNKCDKISLKEITNPYNVLNNTGGWGAPNIDTNDIVTSTVSILPFAQETLDTAVGVGSIAGTVFTDTTHTSGNFAIGQYLSGAGIVPGTQIVGLITGTGNNNGGTYAVNISQTIGPITVTGSNAPATYILKNGVTNLYTTLTNNPIPVEGTIISESPWFMGDGIYYTIYTIVDSSDLIYTNERQYTLFICNLCNCKDHLVVKLINACSTPEVKKLKEQVDQIEVFIYGIKTAFACGDLDMADAILTAATNYCKTISNCGCGCGDCK